MAKSLRKVVHEKLSVKIYAGDKALTIKEAKTLMGWHGEKDPDQKELFGDNYKFKDAEGVKVRLDNCDTNRPFRRGLALTYANDILRSKFRLNGETIVIDVRDSVQSGQHRLCGLIMAEQLRKKEPKTWSEGYGTRGELSMECIVVTGISDASEVVDTLDIGQKRSLGDVIFRNRQFEKYTESEQIKLANILQGAVRVVWLCMGGNLVTSAPKLLHSVALDLIEDHPKLLDCVAHVFSEDAEGEKQIRNYISLGYAAGLMYLMATVKTNTVKYDTDGASALDFKTYEEAEKFWTLFAAGGDDIKKGHPIFVLKTFLTGASASAGHERDEIIAAVKLAWNAFHDSKTLAGVNDLKPGHITDKKTQKKTIDMPYMGGLDVKKEAPPKAEKPPKAPKAPKAPRGKPAKKGSKKNVSYQFKEGDEVQCQPSGTDPSTKKPYGVYTARVSKIADDGKVIVVAKAGNKEIECELNPADGDYVGLEAPPEDVK